MLKTFIHSTRSLIASGLLGVASCLPLHAAVTEAWVQRYNGPANSLDSAYAVAVGNNGNVVVTGYSYNTNGPADCYTAKYAAANGALLWEKRYDGTGNDIDTAYAVAMDSAGNVVVTGYSYNAGKYSDYYTAKYAGTDGALLWDKRYNGGGNDSAIAVALDACGNVLVTGYSHDTNSTIVYYTAKYAAADGTLLWEQRSHGPAGYDEALAMAVDGNGNVVVTGASANTNGNIDFYTAKYAATDGRLLWDKRYNGPANRDDRAHAVAVDSSGNVVVAGFSDGPNNDDYYTAKYAAMDGTLLWERRYNGPQTGVDQATAVAVDGVGNVVVTGFSVGGADSDYYTAKYAAADGALLWEKRYNGPADLDDWATAVAVDSVGNVIVTGYSDNGNRLLRNNDYYTAKYAAANGALLWEKRYNSPGDGDDSPTFIFHGLALGPNGTVAVTGSSSGDYATVVYQEKLPPVSVDLVSTGVRIRFPGAPGHNYEVQRAVVMAGPWITIGAPTASPNGLIEYVDTNPPTATAFYRIGTP